MSTLDDPDDVIQYHYPKPPPHATMEDFRHACDNLCRLEVVPAPKPGFWNEYVDALRDIAHMLPTALAGITVFAAIFALAMLMRWSWSVLMG